MSVYNGNDLTPKWTLVTGAGAPPLNKDPIQNAQNPILVVFNNKLYAGRRRFITQYVELFPLPNPACNEAMEIVALAKEIHALTPSNEANQLAADLDARIWRVFGLPAEKISG